MTKSTVLILGALAGLGGGLAAFLATRDPKAADLISECYRESGGFRFRLPGVDPIPATGKASKLEHPESAALIRAEVVIRQQLKRQPDDPSWFEALVILRLLRGDHESAEKLLARALDTWPDRPQFSLFHAIVLIQKGKELGREDLFAGAYTTLAQLIKDTPSLQESALYNRAILAEEMFLFRRASEDWNHYLSRDRTSKWRVSAASRQASLAKRMVTQNESLYSANQFLADRTRRSIPAESVIDSAMTEWLPNAPVPNGEGLEGEALTELAARLVSQNDDPWLHDLMTTYGHDGWIEATSSLARARTFNLKGQRAAANLNAQRAIRAFNRMGVDAGVLAARVQAMYAINRSLTVGACLEAAKGLEQQLEARGYLYLLSNHLLELGSCQGRSNMINAAEISLKRARTVAVRARYSNLELRVMSVLANHYIAAGNPMESWNECWLGLTKFWGEGREYGPLRGHQLYYNFSLAAERLGYPELALALDQETLQFTSKTPDRLQAAEGLLREGSLAFRVGDRAAMARAFEAGNLELFRLPDDRVRKQYEWVLRKRLAEVDLAEGRALKVLLVLDQFKSLILGQDLPKERLDYFWLRSRAAAMMGNSDQQLTFLLSAVEESERAFARLTNEEGRVRWRVQAGAIYRSLVEITLKKPGSAGEALRIWKHYLDRSTQASIQCDGLSHCMEFDSKSWRTATLVSFIWLQDRIGVWVADDRKVEFSWIGASSSSLSRLRQRFVRQCSDVEVPEGEVRRTARQLANELFSGTSLGANPERFQSRMLVVETDGELGEIPFEALVDKNERYMVESNSILYSQGMRRRANSIRPSLLSSRSATVVVASPKLAGKLAQQFPPLQDAWDEANNVAKSFHNATTLSGSGATIDAVKRALAGAELFHFAGHGLSQSDNGAILLASQDEADGGALMTTEALGNQPLHECQLVVLSSCASGVGERRGPVNPNSLVSGFLRSGVRTVIASRWKIDSEATGVLMQHFYKVLLSRGDVSKALRDASQHVRSQPATSHPYFWSAFSTFGG